MVARITVVPVRNAFPSKLCTGERIDQMRNGGAKWRTIAAALGMTASHAITTYAAWLTEQRRPVKADPIGFGLQFQDPV